MIERLLRSPARIVAWPLLLLCGLALLSGCHKKHKRDLLDNDVLYDRAQKQIEQRKFQQAIQTLGDIGLTNPVSDQLDPEVKLALADAYFYQGGTVSAVEAQSRYEQFLSFYPLHPKSPYARYMIGVCLLEQAEDPQNDQEFSQKALVHFQSMVAELPQANPWNLAARVMLAKAQDRLAEHEWAIGTFYMHKSSWQGAIGRFNTLLDKYPGSRRRGDAFLEVAQAYRNSGDVAQARLSLDRLLAEFPDGPLAQRAAEMKKSLEGRTAAHNDAQAGTGSAGSGAR